MSATRSRSSTAVVDESLVLVDLCNIPSPEKLTLCSIAADRQDGTRGRPHNLVSMWPHQPVEQSHPRPHAHHQQIGLDPIRVVDNGFHHPSHFDAEVAPQPFGLFAEEVFDFLPEPLQHACPVRLRLCWPVLDDM